MTTPSYYIEPYEKEGIADRFLEALGAILQDSNHDHVLAHYSRIGVRCARCATTCPVYQASNDPDDIPCRRSELLFKVYRRHFTTGGQLRGKILNSFEITDDHVHEMAEAAYRCTACRRCKFECPMGIDHGIVTRIMRWALAEVGLVPKALVVSVREQLEGKTGNTSAIPPAAMVDNCEFLEEELKDEFGVDVKFPIDVEGAEYVFFPAVSDFLLEPETLMGNAAVMAATGGSWTIGTGNFDGINYGLFYSDRMLGRIVRREAEEIQRLGAQGALMGECGHATRSAKAFIPTFCGGEDAPPVTNIMQYTHRMLKEGKLKLNRDVIEERVTYHDPCNLARTGWITEEPREILQHICADYVEMTPNREHNYCCGGGGGTVSIDEIREFRTKVGGKTKADQIRRTGAKLVVAPCANCKKQLREVCEDNGLEDVEIVGLHDLVLKAMDWEANGFHVSKPDSEEAN